MGCQVGGAHSYRRIRCRYRLRALRNPYSYSDAHLRCHRAHGHLSRCYLSRGHFDANADGSAARYVHGGPADTYPNPHSYTHGGGEGA